MTQPADTPRGLGRAGQKARATRAALVEVAAELFAEKGYVETSIRDITRRGAVTSGAVYGHFRNKADLLAEAVNLCMAEELESRSVELLGGTPDYIATLTRLAAEYAQRKRLRALLVQGAAAAQTDEETRTELREEQEAHLQVWLEGYERERDGLGIHPSVDMEAALLFTWAVELGLGVLECLGIEPTSTQGWADMHNRFARSLQLPPDRQPSRRPGKQGRGAATGRSR